MPLTGHLSDLSLSELIEFFCNQRKTGRLKVLYPQGPGYFYLQSGWVMDGRIGVLKGIDAVYYALTLRNAEFEFAGNAEPAERTINQPWTQVVLEGLRRLDEGMTPPRAFPEGYTSDERDIGPELVDIEDIQVIKPTTAPSFLAHSSSSGAFRKPLIISAVAVGVLISVAAIGVPAGWYGRHNPAPVAPQPAAAPAESPNAGTTVTTHAETNTAPAADPHAN